MFDNSDITNELVEINLDNDSEISHIPDKNRIPNNPISSGIPLDVKRPLQKTESAKSLKPIGKFNSKLLPCILKHLDIATLLSCRKASWATHRICSAIIYEKIYFSQLSGKKLGLFLNTLQNSILSRDGRGLTTLDYASYIQTLTIKNIVFEEKSSLQCWKTVRDVISLVGDNLISLNIGIGDESFMDLSSDYLYLPNGIALSRLKNLSLQSKCSQVPSKLVLELLRAAPLGGLTSIKFYRCMPNFDATGWFLIEERGGKSLRDLVLSPSVGPNMLSWDETLFNQGVQNISKVCTNIAKIDLSGHAIVFPNQALENFSASKKLLEFYAPCTMTDAHLLINMSKPVWPLIKCIGLSCMCVDGEMKEKQKNGMSCNRFTDHVLLEFLDFLMSSPSSQIKIYLPVYLIALKTGKRIETLHWLSCSMHITKREKDVFWFKEKLVLSIYSNRLANFF